MRRERFSKYLFYDLDLGGRGRSVPIVYKLFLGNNVCYFIVVRPYVPLRSFMANFITVGGFTIMKQACGIRMECDLLTVRVFRFVVQSVVQRDNILSK